MEAYEYSSILARMLEKVPAKYDKREGSLAYTLLAPMAWIASEVYWIISWMLNLAYPDTATDDYLDLNCSAFGVDRKAATNATRQAKFYNQDGVLMDVPLGTRWRKEDITLKVTEKISTGVYQLQVEQTGIIGNNYTGEMLPIGAVEGLSSAILEGVLVQGSDDETDDELRERFYVKAREVNFGGNISDYKMKALEIDGVGAVEVFPIWDGPGTVKVIIGDNDGNAVSGTLVSDVQELFQPIGGSGLGLAPIGHTVTITTSTNLNINVTATVTIKSGASMEIIQPLIETNIRAYLDGISFSEPTIFVAQITVAILSTEGVIDASSVSINGSASNLVLDKTSTNYITPVSGTITLTKAV